VQKAVIAVDGAEIASEEADEMAAAFLLGQADELAGKGLADEDLLTAPFDIARRPHTAHVVRGVVPGVEAVQSRVQHERSRIAASAVVEEALHAAVQTAPLPDIHSLEMTPDGRFIIGESSLVRGFVMAGGCNAHGISGSAGIGHLLVQSLLEREPSNYVTSLSPDRFTEKPWDWGEACKQAQAVYETYYGV